MTARFSQNDLTDSLSWIISLLSISSTPCRHWPCKPHPPNDEEANFPTQHAKHQCRTTYISKASPSNSEKPYGAFQEPACSAHLPRRPELATLPQSPASDRELEGELTPERQKLRHSRLSSLLEIRGSPKSFESREGSEISDFSSLVFGLRKTPSASRRCPRNMGEMSIAKLTSGVADGGWRTR